MRQAAINKYLGWHHTARNTFGASLKAQRLSSGMGRRLLAVRSGVQERRLAAIEANESPPSYEEIKDLATVLRVSADELLAAAGYRTTGQEA